MALRFTDQLYSPSDDSFLLVEALSGLNLLGKRILDMGTGSGFIAIYCALAGASVTAADIDPVAVELVRRKARDACVEMNVLRSDLFDSIQYSKYDIITFNPPYLPSCDRFRDVTIHGGGDGLEVSRRFLRGLPQRLYEGGYSLIVLSSASGWERLKEDFQDLHFEALRRQRLFFEELSVVKVSLRKKTQHDQQGKPSRHG